MGAGAAEPHLPAEQQLGALAAGRSEEWSWQLLLWLWLSPPVLHLVPHSGPWLWHAAAAAGAALQLPDVQQSFLAATGLLTGQRHLSSLRGTAGACCFAAALPAAGSQPLTELPWSKALVWSRPSMGVEWCQAGSGVQATQAHTSATTTTATPAAPTAVYVIEHTRPPTHTHTHTHLSALATTSSEEPTSTCSQAGRQAVRQAVRRSGRQAGRQAGRKNGGRAGSHGFNQPPAPHAGSPAQRTPASSRG